MAGFAYRRNIDGSSQSPVNLDLVGANSVVFSIGDLIRVNQGGQASLVTGGDLVLGVVSGVVGSDGESIDPDSASLDTYTMESDNVTVLKRKIKYIPALANYLWFNDADGSLTDTMLFQYFNVNDENDVDVASPSDTTISTVRLIQRDPDDDGDASKGLFQIVESFWAQNAMGTVDTGGIEAA